MGRYTSISDISKTIIDMLKNSLSEDSIVSPENIGVCDPGERGNFVVGIHPYDIKENTEARSSQQITYPDGSMRNPPVSMSMSIMVSIVSKAEISAKGLDEQRILGKVIQTFMDYPRLPSQFMPETLRKSNENISVQFVNMEMEDKVKIWSMFSQPYKLCCFYSVGPILIESALVRKPAPRVTSVHLDSTIIGGNKF